MYGLRIGLINMNYEPNEGTLKIIPKPGEVRNPTGFNNPPGRRRSQEIKAALQAGLNERCDIEGFEHLTFFEYGIRSLMYLWCAGDKWACTFVANRVWGRVPLDIAMDVTTHESLQALSDQELLARVDALRAQLAPAPEQEEQQP